MNAEATLYLTEEVSGVTTGDFDAAILSEAAIDGEIGDSLVGIGPLVERVTARE